MPKSRTHCTFSQSLNKKKKKEKGSPLITFHIFINNIKAISSGKTSPIRFIVILEEVDEECKRI